MEIVVANAHALLPRDEREASSQFKQHAFVATASQQLIRRSSILQNHARQS